MDSDETPVAAVATPSDPVLAQRARAAELAAMGKRLGYGVLGVAVLVFVGGLVFGLRSWMTGVVAACFVLSALLLVPAVIVGYGVKAAAREDPGPQAR
ncbi:MAG: hypothetical protein R2754_14485 [Microthrixaceae bacterium]